MGLDMSHSYRKPYSHWCGGSSNKADKRLAHRAHRARTRQGLSNYKDYDEIYTPTKNIETSDIYCFNSDGGAYYIIKPNESDEKWLHDWYEKSKRK